METTLAGLKVTHEAVADERGAELVAQARALLPYQQVQSQAEEAAIQFGLPITGQEIHERVRRTLRPRWHLPVAGWIGVIIFSCLAALFLGGFTPWAVRALEACRGADCGDAKLGLAASVFCGILWVVLGGVVLASNLQIRRRTSLWTQVASYTKLIPARALAKFAVAQASGLFQAMYVVEPGYEQIAPRVRRDPWLIGCVAPWDSPPSGDDRRVYVVLAYWD